jgi:hypothetical protein
MVFAKPGAKTTRIAALHSIPLLSRQQHPHGKQTQLGALVAFLN